MTEKIIKITIKQLQDYGIDTFKFNTEDIQVLITKYEEQKKRIKELESALDEAKVTISYLSH